MDWVGWIAILAIVLLVVLAARRRRRSAQLRAEREAEAFADSYRRWRDDPRTKASDQWHFVITSPSWNGSLLEVFLTRYPDGEIEMLSGKGRITEGEASSLVAAIFTRQQERAGEELWWPELAGRGDDAMLGQFGSYGWSYDGPARPSARMLEN